VNVANRQMSHCRVSPGERSFPVFARFIELNGRPVQCLGRHSSASEVHDLRGVSIVHGLEYQ
jgi:hypothetical protein